MRKSIAKKIEYLMSEDKNVYLLFGDLGNNILDSVRKKFPERAINFGISEQAMIGAASGLALEGKIPIVYSIAPFVSSRVLEQIKLSVCQQRQKIIIIGCGSGFSYGSLGPTHHCLEDFAILNCLPNIEISMPYDETSAGLSLMEAYNKKTESTYIRLGRDNLDLYMFDNNIMESLHKDNPNDIIVANGTIAFLAEKVASKLDLDLMLITSSKQIEKEYFMWPFYQNETLACSNFYVIEDTYKNGGIYSAMCPELFDISGIMVNLIRFGPTDFSKFAGNHQDLMSEQGLDCQSICEKISKKLLK